MARLAPMFRSGELVLLAAGLTFALWDRPAFAQMPFAPTNPWQEKCVRAFDETRDLGLWPDGVDSWDEGIAWGVQEYGSEEAFGRAVQTNQRKSAQRKLSLLRPAADAGHLPSMYRMLSYFRGSAELKDELRGLPSDVERESWARLLYERGFPLASKPTPPGAYDQGFNGNHTPPPSEEFLRKLKKRALPRIRDRLAHEVYTSHEEAASLRAAHIDALRWSAARGNTASWERLERAYEQVARKFGGDIEYLIERYALLEITQRLWTLGDESNVPRKHQEELAETIAAQGQLERAQDLARRYVRELWPRRIQTRKDGDVCRLQPQFKNDRDPYRDQLAILSELEPPIPPALRPPPKPRRRIDPVVPAHMRVRSDCGRPYAIGADCY